ncbi:NAD(P)/FAD-dependent oxidoreductase [Caballeronia sp. LjRoot34]|uniref:NAD(P)/FAD-dependent oxidoreductase n=1 Tax=Caballeronia sp. LjRoot34 TaxID=3342325 RepID=UPI003ECDDB01
MNEPIANNALFVAEPAQSVGHHVVIVGGGASGLELATQLSEQFRRKGSGSVTLLDRARTHLWKPLLHSVAAGSMDPGEHEVDYLAQAYWHNFRFRFGEMIGLDRANKRVAMAATYDEDNQIITPARSIPYDTLVIAIGSVTNDFGTPGASEFAVPLETVDQAKRFNRRLINACLRAQTQADPIRPGQLHVAIIGAGATGTELAAELYRTTREVVAFNMDRIKPDADIKIILVEAGPRVLPALPEHISSSAMDFLKNLGVDVRTNARVAEVSATGIRLASGESIAAELVVWAAGVKAPDVLREIGGLETNRINQLVVTSDLQTTRDTNVFAMGDCAQCPYPGSDTPVPPRAQAAHQEASHLLKQLQNHIEGKPIRPYRYRDFGSLVTLGKYKTIGNLMGFVDGRSFRVEGFIARFMYRSLYKMHEYAVSGGRRVFFSVLGRSLSRRSEPQVKLH